MFECYMPDLDAYVKRVRSGPCFVCKIVARDPAFTDHRIVYEHEGAIGFLAMNPTQYGYTLITPNEHNEQVAGDFRVEEYPELQRVLHRVAGAVRAEVGAELVYILSLCSNQGNAHVHWHVVPLPPDTPYTEQQFAAVMLETAGALKIPDREKAVLAARVGQRMDRSQVDLARP
jgi:diadenosine tetraphosphate (Ap4A) HIT family hydrolase